MKVATLLNKPYSNETDGWKAVLFISAFLTLFLILFRPFGLDSSNFSFYLQKTLSHGIVTLVSLVINVFIVPKIFTNVFTQEKWNIRKQFFWFLWNVVTIGLCNYAFAKVVNGHFDFNFSEVFAFITNSLLISIIPISFLTLLDYNKVLKRNLDEAITIADQLESFHQRQNPHEQIMSLNSASKKSVISISCEKLLFVESEGNYVRIWFFDDDQLQNKTIRNTLKSIENQLKEFPNILKVHRAFIININHVIKVTGNSQGSKVLMKASNKEITIARNYIKAFKNTIENIT